MTDFDETTLIGPGDSPVNQWWLTIDSIRSIRAALAGEDSTDEK